MSDPIDRLHIKPVRTSPWRVLTLLALLLYLGLALYQLNLSGLNYDEALDAAPAMQTVLGERIDGGYSLQLGGRSWPLMVQPWFGPTTTYLLVAAFSLFGISATTVRATGIFVGLISLLLIWGFLKEYLDERVASLSILLLAVSPGYVFWSRMIAWVHFPLLPIAVATIWLLFRWYSRRQGRYLVMAAFGLGLGLQTHIVFLLVWGGLGLAWLLLSPWLGTGRGWRRWLWPWQITGMRTWGMGVVALLLGALPLLIYNLQSGGTVQGALSLVSAGEVAPIRNAAAMRNVASLGFSAFATLVGGGWFASRLGGLHRNALALPAFGLALGLVGWLAALDALTYSRKRVALFVILAVSMPLQMSLMGDAGTQHLLLAWPIPQAVLGVALFGLADYIARGSLPASAASQIRRSIAQGVLGLAALCLIGAEGLTTLGYHRTLSQTGGVGFFSDAVYALASDLQQPDVSQPIAMDWGFRRNLQVLTQNRIDPPEWFTYSSPPLPEFESYVSELITRYPDALYLFHAPNYTAFSGHQEIFEDVAYRHHLTPVLWKTYRQRDGKPVYQVYTLKPTPRLFEPPSIEHPLNVRLGDGLALLGYDRPQDRVRPGEDIKLTLYWKAIAPQSQNYKVFAHLLDDSGKLWGQHDDFPVYGSYPMTDWQTGEIVADRIEIESGTDVPPGSYHVFVGMYDKATGGRLPLSLDGQRLKGDTLGLVQITIDHPGSE